MTFSLAIDFGVLRYMFSSFLLFPGEELGQPHYAVPFLAPNTTGRAVLTGVNYASGGGGILNATGRIFVRTLNSFLVITGDYASSTLIN